ncbi:hypothetical protein GCM10011594_16990 [Nakamurella endophytica]|uniref:DUF2218 domain-containing protein n=1 Tax=Nakamurella endophytica TaxID=1748367 RepID=A0A917SV72_9ACTN|nr:DUF2218 domain-containing protein [Nakamurella endophytica]GGL97735.1 hypothetical protein GCM10011594_16990 [Nakamurella endophytica]
MLSSRADVATATPERYAKQLVFHLGRRLEWHVDGDTSTADIAGSTAVVRVAAAAVVLEAHAPDAESLERVQHVLGSHLERFGQRQELVVSWVAG